MLEHAPQQKKSAEAEFSPAILKTLELLDNLAHFVVAALFIIMAVTVLIHTCFILTRQIPLITNLPPTQQETTISSDTEKAVMVPGKREESAPNTSATTSKLSGASATSNSDTSKPDASKADASKADEGKPHEGKTNLADPFYRVSLDLLSSILFAVIILELLRTIITYLQTHDIQAIMQEFLVVGIISSVRKILLVGAEASLSGSAGIAFIQEATGVLLNILGIMLLIVGLFLLRRGNTKKGEHDT